MAFSRYTNTSRINAGTQLGTSTDVSRLRLAIRAGSIPIIRSIVTTGVERLDIISGIEYGDSRYWWVLAAASDIGWGMQVPSDTVINIVKLSDVQSVM